MYFLNPVTAITLWIIASFLEQTPKAVASGLTMGELGADSLDMVEIQALLEEEFVIVIEPQLATFVTFSVVSEQVHKALSAQGKRQTTQR